MDRQERGAAALNFLLGNDIVVKLDSDKDTLPLVGGETGNVTFTVGVIANPFCVATCEGRLLDVGDGTSAQDRFNLTTGASLERSYALRAPDAGHGEVLYQYAVACHSVPTVLCHTAGKRTQRALLVTLPYNLSQAQAALKAQAALDADSLRARIAAIEGTIEGIDATLPSLPGMGAAPNATALMAQAQATEARLRAVREPWGGERYADVAQALEGIGRDLAPLEAQVSQAADAVEQEAQGREGIAASLDATRASLAAAAATPLRDVAVAQRLNSTVESFDASLATLGDGTLSLAQRRRIADGIAALAGQSAAEVNASALADAMDAAVAGDVALDARCALLGDCALHPSILERSQGPPSIAEACAYLDGVRLQALGAGAANLSNASAGTSGAPGTNMSNASVAPASPSAEMANASALARSAMRSAADALAAQLAQDASGNFSSLALAAIERLEQGNASAPANASMNASAVPASALAAALAQQLPPACGEPLALAQPAPLAFPQVVPLSRVPAELNFSLEEPAPACCVRGVCQACCADCAESDYPIVFLHGHAFNKDTLADYSLDAFGPIERRLGDEGYLDAGAISLYTPRNETLDGDWGHANVSLMIGASYYFDLFKETDSYVIVQTKSESIDTYAIRLKDLIDTIRDRTGKRKVTIVAHSMGGLVARRYLQIFGTDAVDGLVLIATPNGGISGSTARYCPLIGESLECDDMAGNGLFMNKLNRDPLPGIPIYNIIATGCDTDGGPGDGVVTQESATLPGAHNVVVNGTCGTLAPLHTQILDVERYPQLYAELTRALGAIRSRPASS